MALYLFLVPPQYSPILAIFIRETLLRSDHKQIASLINSSIKISMLSHIATEIASRCSLLGMIRDRDQTALNIEAMQNQGYLNSRKSEKQVRD